MTYHAFELLVFDWDGTIVDSAAAIVAALQTACHDLNLTVPSRESALSIIGLGMREALFRVVPDLQEAQFEPLRARYREAYAEMEQQVILFDGVFEGLTVLRQQGYRTAVATGKSRAGLNRALDQAGLNTCFDYTRCADECPSKPAPDMLLEIMEVLSVSSGRTLMVGDTTHDLEMARNAGVQAVAMLYGAHPEAALAACHPLNAFNAFSDFVSWIQSLKN